MMQLKSLQRPTYAQVGSANITIVPFVFLLHMLSQGGEVGTVLVTSLN